jgi:hypothetical protein
VEGGGRRKKPNVPAPPDARDDVLLVLVRVFDKGPHGVHLGVSGLEEEEEVKEVWSVCLCKKRFSLRGPLHLENASLPTFSSFFLPLKDNTQFPMGKGQKNTLSWRDRF